MQENNFEKQVRRKMDELKLKPSDEVWQKVAGSIEKRKSRRRIFFLIFLLLLLIGSAIFMITNKTTDEINNPLASKKSNTTVQQNTKQNIIDSNGRQTIVTSNNPETISGDAADADLNKNDIAKIKKRATPQKYLPAPGTTSLVALNDKGTDNQASDAKATGKNHPNKTSKRIRKTRQQLIVSVSNGNAADLANEVVGSNDSSETKLEEVPKNKNDVTVKRQVTDSVSKEVTGLKKQASDTVAAIVKVVSKKDAAVKSSMPSKQKSKWKLGFNFSLGSAATQGNYLGILGSGNDNGQLVYSFPNQSTGGPSNSGTASATPSAIKNAGGFVAGGFVQRKISTKTNMLIGLNYKSYNTSMVIGSRVDSSNILSLTNYFYRSGNKNNYKNHFHFIELPVSFQFKLGRQNKLPVYLNTGISISRLIGTNALQFDTPSGSYYSNNSLFNKTQLSLSAGLLFSLFNQAKNPVRIGPDVNFSLAKMANTGLYKDRRYSYFGILLQKGIGKK